MPLPPLEALQEMRNLLDQARQNPTDSEVWLRIEALASVIDSHIYPKTPAHFEAGAIEENSLGPDQSAQ